MIRKVLVVDDYVGVRDMVRGVLQSFGYAVSVAGSAEEALRLCETTDFDVVVTDLTMGEISGVQLAIRLGQKNGHHPIVALMSTHVAEVETGGYVSLALQKPFGFPQLRDAFIQLERLVAEART
jgi:CheY-like chemotaxis protein